MELPRRVWPWESGQEEKKKGASQGDDQSFERVEARKRLDATSAIRSDTSSEIARSGKARRETKEDLMH